MNLYFALVTGASSGIGKAIAIELAKKQINILLVALPQTGLPELATQLANEFQIEVKFYEVDLTCDGAAREVYDWCTQQNISINILINNAGLGIQNSFEDTPVPELETMLRLNNQALVMLAYYFLPDLKKNAPSHILNVGSLASFMSIPGKAVYAASKSFIYSFSLTLRMELRLYNINVSCLCPGGTITSDRAVEIMQRIRLAGRMMVMMPDEVAREAVYYMYQGKKLIIPGWKNRLLYKLWAILPQRLIDLILAALFSNKHKSDNKSKPKVAVAFNAIRFK